MESLHDFIPELLPGIKKVISVYYDEGKLKGIFTKKTGNAYSTKSMNLEGMDGVLERYMESNSHYDWYSKQSLPFEVHDLDTKAIKDIFSELENVVLLIRLSNTAKNKKSLVFIYFQENPGNFGLTNSINPLTTDTKSMIAFLLRNQLEYHMNQREQNLRALKAHNKHTRSIISRAENERDEFKRIRHNYGMSLVKLCKQYIQEYSRKSGTEFTLSEGAIERIKNYKSDLGKLSELFLKSLAYAESLHLDENTGSIVILDWHLQLDSTATDETPTALSASKSGQKYEKTILLLNKLEQAAMRVKTERLKMTGTNVGQAFKQPITAPAISDALFNHKAKINTLVLRYPDKWKTIRAEFRPLRNILTEK